MTEPETPADTSPDGGQDVPPTGRGCLGCEEPPPPPSSGPGAERAVAGAFVLSMLGAVGLAVVYARGGQPQLEGTFLAVSLGGLGVGLILWAKRFMPHEPVVEARHPIASSEEDIAKFRAEFQQGEDVLTRRRLLVRTAGGAVATLGAALLFPIRSLGPRPGKGLKETAFAEGVRLVTIDGEPVRAEGVATDSVVTVFPAGQAGAADSPTLLIRPDAPVNPRPGREDWGADGLVAYSKLCTHVGCPVGLYQAAEHQLLCPCHQSTFDVLDGARPVFGPAARSLPQLPLDIDDEGFVVAAGEFSDPPGPGFWDRGR